MDKLAIGLKIAPEELSKCVEIHKRICSEFTTQDTFILELDEKAFLKDLLNGIIQSSVTKANKLESIGNDFLSCYELARKNH